MSSPDFSKDISVLSCNTFTASCSTIELQGNFLILLETHFLTGCFGMLSMTIEINADTGDLDRFVKETTLIIAHSQSISRDKPIALEFL